MVTFNLERFIRVLKIFTGHLRESGEDKTAEAVEAIIKFSKIFIVK